MDIGEEGTTEVGSIRAQGETIQVVVQTNSRKLGHEDFIFCNLYKEHLKLFCLTLLRWYFLCCNVLAILLPNLCLNIIKWFLFSIFCVPWSKLIYLVVQLC